ncbi:MAG TPA: UbiX family flavin prenyltransferase [Methanomicrobiales archaeon]|jgi:4-hydroxy-3-polyprenylbenzoate decarboxylase|nr:UbiX family flavin prenyltransferase [Methanomicrobiales archaeon]
MGKVFVVGITGASGIVYGRRIAEEIARSAEVRLIVSGTAREIGRHEGVDLDGLRAAYEQNDNLAALISSGSFRHDGMVIAPCSMKTLAGIAHGYAETLVNRAADVTLKERRRCILLLREMPLSRVHLQNMLTAHDAGATVMVASPAFYHRPGTIDGLVDMVVARVLDHLDVPHDLPVRWRGYDA